MPQAGVNVSEGIPKPRRTSLFFFNIPYPYSANIFWVASRYGAIDLRVVLTGIAYKNELAIRAVLDDVFDHGNLIIYGGFEYIGEGFIAPAKCFQVKTACREVVFCPELFQRRVQLPGTGGDVMKHRPLFL